MRPRAYRNPSQPPFTALQTGKTAPEAVREPRTHQSETAWTSYPPPDTDGMPSHDTRFHRIPGHEGSIPGRERPIGAETPPPPARYHVGTTPWAVSPGLAGMPRPDDGTPTGNSGPRGPMETRFDYIDTVWAE